MSPLARTLFALASLFVAGDAMPNPFCSSLSRGKPEADIKYGFSSKTFVIMAKGDEITTIPDRYTMPGRQLMGDHLRVCNAPYNRPVLITPMGIRDELSAVYISCPKFVPGCSNLELHVTQYGETERPYQSGGVLG